MTRLGQRALPAWLALVVGCGASEADGAGAAPEASVSCAGDPRLDAYAGALEKTGERGVLTFRFSDFEPAQPSRGNNTFHVLVADASGTPLSGDASSPGSVSLSVGLFMPDHGHGTSVEPAVRFEAGRHTLAPLFLFMPGVWRVELEAQSTAGGELLDRVTLHFCVEG